MLLNSKKILDEKVYVFNTDDIYQEKEDFLLNTMEKNYTNPYDTIDIIEFYKGGAFIKTYKNMEEYKKIEEHENIGFDFSNIDIDIIEEIQDTKEPNVKKETKKAVVKKTTPKAKYKELDLSKLIIDLT